MLGWTSSGRWMSSLLCMFRVGFFYPVKRDTVLRGRPTKNGDWYDGTTYGERENTAQAGMNADRPERVCITSLQIFTGPVVPV
jgi:hypothetical protein